MSSETSMMLEVSLSKLKSSYFKNTSFQNFPGCAVVNTPPSNAEGTAWTPGWAPRCCMPPGKKEKHKTEATL